jgi:hypothetical protein
VQRQPITFLQTTSSTGLQDGNVVNMSTVEAAASLFGSDGDSGPDPFAVIGHEETDTTPPTGLMRHDTEQHDFGSYPSNMGQDTSSLFAEDHMPQGTERFPLDSWPVPKSQDFSAPDTSQHSNNSASRGRYPEPSYSSTAHPQASYAPQPGLSSVRRCSGLEY